MTHMVGNPRGAQNVARGKVAKERRQDFAWNNCSGHEFSTKGKPNRDGQPIMRCKHCGAPQK